MEAVEQEIRSEMMHSNAALRDGTHGALAKVLKAVDVDPSYAYVVHWIPEQAEDIFEVLVSPTEVLVAEIPRPEGTVQYERRDLASYRAKRSKSTRLKIAIAEQLLESGRRLR